MPFLPRAVLAGLLFFALPAMAKPVAYVLEPTASSVGFETDFGPDKITGDMPVSAANLVLDFDRLANSTIDVTLDVTEAKASFPFAAQAMKGPKVLDSEQFPVIRFLSTSVDPQGDGASVSGNVTIRGVTRPLTLAASIYRQTGTEVGDRRHLSVLLQGSVRRSEFGATGWAGIVGDEVRLTILARIEQAP